MDAEIVLVVGGIVDLILSEGDVANSNVVEVPAVSRFKARHGDIRFGVQQAGDATGYAVQLHAVQLGRCHGLGQAAEEVAHAAGGLQDVAGLEAHAAQSLVDSADNHGRSKVGVQGAGPGGNVLVIGQQGFQFGVLGGPLGLVRLKGVRDAAPAHIAGEDLLLGRSGNTALGFQVL